MSPEVAIGYRPLSHVLRSFVVRGTAHGHVGRASGPLAVSSNLGRDEGTQVRAAVSSARERRERKRVLKRMQVRFGG